MLQCEKLLSRPGMQRAFPRLPSKGRTDALDWDTETDCFLLAPQHHGSYPKQLSLGFVITSLPEPSSTRLSSPSAWAV